MTLGSAIIFFTLTSTFKRVGELELRLPDSSTSEAVAEDEEERRVELIVTEDGRLFLGEEVIELPGLKRKLVQSREEAPEREILIKAEGGVDHAEVVFLLDLVRDAGFPGVGIGTHRTPPPVESP